MEPDEALFVAMRAGEMRAFDALYARYERSLFGFIRRFVSDRAEAEDVFHEAFLSVLRSGDLDVSRPGSFRAWLFEVARHASLKRIRSRERGARASEAVRAMEPAHQPGPEEIAARGETALALDRAVAKLPDPLAQVFQLRASGMSYEEMAGALKSPLGTIKSRMHEAVRRLREEMKPWIAR